MEWIFANAKAYTELFVFLGTAGGAAAWVWRVLVQSKKNLDALVSSIGEIRAKLESNGGTSLFDLVKETKGKVDVLASDLQRVKAWQWSFSQSNRMPMWESDEKGACIRVNLAMSELTGRSSEQMSGTGWENIMPPSPERAEVWAAWADAVKRGRDFEHTYIIENCITHRRSRVKAVGTPIMAEPGKLVGMLGRFEEIFPL
jgi:PAS domain-containing protein